MQAGREMSASGAVRRWVDVILCDDASQANKNLAQLPGRGSRSFEWSRIDSTGSTVPRSSRTRSWNPLLPTDRMGSPRLVCL
jgi:hypothetical protein